MKEIDDFFAKYEKSANNFDPDLLASLYTDSFMSADPNRTACVQNDMKWKEAATKREQLFKDLGFKFAKIIDKSVTQIDDNYSMVKVHWPMNFENPSTTRSDFKFFITNFVCAVGGALKVCFNISHEDEQKVMREAGLVPKR